MTPQHRPLLNRGARTRWAELLLQSKLEPANDPLLATSFDSGLHAVCFDRLPDDVLDQLHTIEHIEDPITQSIVRRRMPLWVQKHDGYELPNRLVPLMQQYYRRRSGALGSPPAEPDVNVFTSLTDPLVPAALNMYGRAGFELGAGVRVASLIAGLLQANLGQRAAVVCSNRPVVGQLTKDLRQAEVDVAAYYVFTCDNRPRPAVAVGTPAGLASPSATVDHVDLVVVLDPAWFCGLAGIPLRMVENLVRVPWLGLLPTERSLTPLERDIITCFFGPFRFEIPDHGQICRQVLFTRQPVVLPPGQGYDRLVMALAGELAAPNRRKVGGRFGVVRQTEGNTGLVVVLAQDARHRRALQRTQKPADHGGVRVVTPAELAGLDEMAILIRADRRPPTTPPAVLTRSTR